MLERMWRKGNLDSQVGMSISAATMENSIDVPLIELPENSPENSHLKKVKVAQSCPTLCDPMDYTVHGNLQARLLE